MKKAINGVKYDFESHIGEPTKRYNKFDYDAEYRQIINGVEFKGIREFRVKSGAYRENFVFNGVKYSSELKFAQAALETSKQIFSRITTCLSLNRVKRIRQTN